MLKRLKLTALADFWMPLAARRVPGIYFCRIAGYHGEVRSFLEEAVRQRRTSPLLLLGQLKNPDEKQLAYFREMMGMDFACDAAFLDRALARWLPRLSGAQRASLTRSMLDTLNGLRAKGKTDNMLRNAYIKFMCWMYYRFEQILHRLGQDPLPKILYDGVLTAHELQLFCVLADAGCDIALLEPHGRAAYEALDPAGECAALFRGAGEGGFPPGFSLAGLLKQAEQAQKQARLYGAADLPRAATNIWLSGDLLADALRPMGERGSEPGCFHNLFARIRGVADKASYVQTLFQWQADIKAQGRVCAVLDSLPVPTPEETAPLSGGSAQAAEPLILGLMPALKPAAKPVLDGLARRAFAELLREQAQAAPGRLSRLKNEAVYLVCWYNRYMPQLFAGWTMEKPPVCVYFGTCRTAFEALFLRFLARLPVDVLEITPAAGAACCLDDPTLFSREYTGTLPLTRFPDAQDGAAIGTVAYHAEQELTEMLYQDSGVYRTQQYHKASAVTLQTMYEEIAMLWTQEAPIRPGFSVVDGDTVLLPVITAKVSGVKHGDTGAYWNDLRALLGEDTYLIRSLPHWTGDGIPAGFNAAQFLRGRRLDRQRIRDSAGYAYGLLREETQTFLLDKLQQLLDSGLIQGTFSRGVEYKIVLVALHLPQALVRLVQRHDLVKQPPKVVLLSTGEQACSLEDAILLAFLHLLGFDEVLFVPTGYQILERYYTQPLFVEHQIGEYLYDLTPPYLPPAGQAAGQRGGLLNRFFRRG